MYYVYILKCSNGKPHTGCTDNLKERIERHQNGYVPATKPLLPIKLVSYFAFTNKYTAFNFENTLNQDLVVPSSKNMRLSLSDIALLYSSSFEIVNIWKTTYHNQLSLSLLRSHQ